MRRASITATAVAIASLALAPSALAQDFLPGSGSLKDPLFPQIGNGGYDAESYDVDLRYSPDENRLETGTVTTMTATATQGLSRFSLDFQRDLEVSAVSVDGVDAAFEQRDAKPEFSSNPKVTQPAKLEVTPAAGIPEGARFTVEIAYSGVPEAIVDADGSVEGWIRACSKPGDCDGSFTVNEPIGAQSWFPSNNYATDKATFTTRITVPDSHVALGAGELASREAAGEGRTTWTWTEDDPTATYLTSASVGRFDFEIGSMTEAVTGATLAIYDAIDSAGPAKAKTQVERVLRRAPSTLNFLSKRLGPYPFDSIGAVADWVPSVGYALENQTKPHYAGDEDGPAISGGLQLHEISHQWMGNSVSARRWTDIWFNEGWATFLEVYCEAKMNEDATTPRQFFRAVYETEQTEFELAPAILDDDPANLFSGFAVYSRPGAMLQGYREIVGNKRFFDFATAIAQGRHAYGTIGRTAFVEEAVAASGLSGGRARKLDRYFDQWLLREGRPSLTPADF